MQNVVYLLGAGFSAPLGLPVMANFLEEAKDLYQKHKDRYPHFEKVFKSIKERLAYVALYYDSDLTNIEEVLSILEMERLAGNVSLEETDELRKFIGDVIEYFTPSIESPTEIERKDQGVYVTAKKNTEWLVTRSLLHMEGRDNELIHTYGEFVLRLFGSRLEVVGIDEEKDVISNRNEKSFQEFEVHKRNAPTAAAKYSIITLNYDLVLENFAKYFTSICKDEFRFSRPTLNSSEGSPWLAKLHGSLDNSNIVPPTWNKSLHSKIEPEWRLAYRLLASANHIRILGYSLPENDAYIKYLLKSSLLESENLKSIDVICRDQSGNVKARYDNFIHLKSSKYRFINGNLENYLGWVNGNAGIENGHEDWIRMQLQQSIAI